MRQQSFRHRGGTSKSIGGGILLVLAVAIGGFLVYHLILWFRSSNATAIANEAIAASDAATMTDSSGKPAPALNSTAVLKTVDGATAGTVVRSGTVEIPTYTLVANLVAPSPESTYEVWLVKDGLADVKSAGMLSPRADGSWAETFTTKDPLDYPTVVIMLEQTSRAGDPSGTRVAEGRFE